MTTLAELKTALAKAERDLSFTGFARRSTVSSATAPPRSATSCRPASASPPGAARRRLLDANFKETQLARLKPGQPVSITVDALPGDQFDGVVSSFSPASGSVFTLLPPDNATGNFTKIIQRLPVRIRVPADVAERGALRPGMSVVATVNTKPGAILAAGLAPSTQAAKK